MNELDIALDRLHLCAFETADGAPNCGPLAALALEHLGHAALTSGLIDVYVPRFPVLPDGAPLRDDQWAEARGDVERASDWLATVEPILQAHPWREVLSQVLGMGSERSNTATLSCDALLRLAYAIDSLEQEESPNRLRELAFALAFVLSKPGAEHEPGDEHANVVELVRRAQGLASKPEELSNLLGEICLVGASHYLASKDQRAARAAHVVLPGALRLLLTHFPKGGTKPILTAMLSGCSAVVAAQETAQSSDEEPDIEVERCAESVTEIRYRAACSVHEHAIMMAQACLREDAISPNPVFRRAAADAALRLSPPGYQEWR